MTDTIYVGRGKESKFGIKLNICLDDLFNYAKDNIEKASNGKKYINLEVCQLKQPDDRGKTHYIKIDTWKPTQGEAEQKGIVNG